MVIFIKVSRGPQVVVRPPTHIKAQLAAAANSRLSDMRDIFDIFEKR
jgi:hypothetical protein